jgi:hypothetical protein
MLITFDRINIFRHFLILDNQSKTTENIYVKNKMSIRQYHIKPNSVFENDIIKKEFKKFLKTEKNEEPLLFLASVEEYKKTTVNDTKLEKLEQIVELFINENSSKQINIGYLEKSKFKSNLQNFDKKSFGENENNIFDEVNFNVNKDCKKYRKGFNKR